MHTSQELATFCKKKGFIYPSSEIYGGLAGFYDYGHLGTLLKLNFEKAWRKFFLGLHPNFFEISASQVMHENVFKASGHLDNFIDPLVTCSKCDFSDRADHFLESSMEERCEDLSPEELTVCIEKNNLTCPKCKAPLNPVSVLNMMFPVTLGNSQKAYLRPETAQSPYVNFKAQYELQRKKLPMGLALIGKAFRNEISPRNMTLRLREFTQAELQIFFNPQKLMEHPDFSSVKDVPLRTMLVQDRSQKMVVERTAKSLVEEEGLPEFYVYYMVQIQKFYLEVLKIPKEKIRFYQLNDKEKAFYNKNHFDIEVELADHGFTELGGLHYRTDYDLSGHQKVSGVKMEVLEESTGNKFIPHVLELSFGVDRHIYSLLDLAYNNDKERGNVNLRLSANTSPFYCSVFPLVKNKEAIVNKASEVFALVKDNFSSFYDEASSVGRRYARADEIGVKYCITIDFDSLDDNNVTVRDRETTKQERIPIEEVVEYLNSKL